jgi:hypothetical protein
MLSPQSLDQRTIAVVLVSLLSSLILLGYDSEPPLVSISAIQQLEDGMSIQLSGLLVDDWAYESGTESIVLADPAGGTTVEVLCAQGALPQPSQYANIGDELLVIGRLSKSGQTCTVYANSDDITVLNTSDEILTVELLVRNWNLFEGDYVRLKGTLGWDGLHYSVRLFSFSRSCSIALDPGGLLVTGLIDSDVLVSAFVRFDYRVSALTLLAKSVVADG